MHSLNFNPPIQPVVLYTLQPVVQSTIRQAHQLPNLITTSGNASECCLLIRRRSHSCPKCPLLISSV